jgi:hypothetical protein
MSDAPENPDESVDTPPTPEESAREKRINARQEARAAMPAVFVDAWATLTWRGHIRIVLGEWLLRKNNYRTAVVMELDQAKEFAEDLLERVQKRIEEDANLAKKIPASDGEC